MRHPLLHLLAILAFVLPAVGAEAGKATKRFQPTGARSLHDLRYLPDDRYCGDQGERRDQEMVLDLHLPDKGPGPFPVLVTVHGGAWISGTKNAKLAEQFMQAALDHGYAAVGLNYIRKPKEIVPQVFYDTQDAIRYLRRVAAQHHLDPTRIGAVGWSAGGWLVSNIGFVSGDGVLSGHQGIALLISEFAQGGKRGNKPWILAEPANPTGFAFPAWSSDPAWGDQYGQIQAMSYDFSFWHNLAQPSAASANQWVGQGFRNKGEKSVTAAGVVYDYAELVAPEAAGRQLHCPDMTSPCLPLTGSAPVSLAERVVQFFDREFGPEGRAPAPEIRPFLRVIDGPVPVSLLVPDPTMKIHYTTDGSEPTTASPAYTTPFTITGKTVVKALAVIAGRKPSGVAIATFLPGPVPPRITGPTAVRLPPAEVGKPYRVTFTSGGVDGPVRWALSGEILPRKLNPRDRDAKPVDVMGLTMDAVSGVLSGTPKVGGTFWVQVAVARGPGQLATVRNYLLPVAGPAGSLGGGDGDQEDPNVEVGILTGWPAAQVQALVAALGSAGCVPVTQADGADTLLLVGADQLAKARPLVEAFARTNRLTFTPSR